MISAALVFSTCCYAQASPVRVANTTFQLPIDTPVEGFGLTDAFPSLVFDHPVAVASPPGETNRLFIVERRGRIIVIPDLSNPSKDVFLDIANKTQSVYTESGLLGLAFHPGYSTNRQFFVYRTLNKTGEGGFFGLHDQVSRFETEPTNPNFASPGSEVVILSQMDTSDDHNGGDIQFGPDGYLYVSIGDNGPPSNRKPATLQTIEGDWFGCILRIDVDKKPGSVPPNPLDGVTTHYAIPSDNPSLD